MSVFSKIKKWLTKKPKDDKIKEANRVTNYGGGASSKSVQKEVKRSIVKAEAKKSGERQTEYQQSAVSKSNSSAFKATPPSVRKAEAKDRQTSKKSDAFNAKNAFKASAQPKFTHQSTALGTMSKRDIDTRTAKKNAYNENYKYQSRAADKLKPLIDEKYSGDTAESRRRIKSGEYQSDPNVMKYETLKHPIAMSAGRGALSGTTFGLSELGIALLPKSKEVEEAERLYQANKSKGAEFAGEMAGSLLGFGLTSGASKAAVTKLAPKTTARLGESATEIIAKNGLVRRAAEKEALRKLGTTATKEEIERFARARAAKLVAALGEDAAINVTTGLASDVSHAIIESDNPAEFLKNMGISAAGNVVLGGVTSAAPLFRNGADSGLERVFAGDVFNRANRANIDEGLERINIRDMVRNNADDAVRRADASNLIRRANQADEALGRAMVNDGAYGNIGRGVLPPSEIDMRGVTPSPRAMNVDPSIESARAREIGLRGNERREVSDRLFSKAAERNPSGNVERPLDSLVRKRGRADERITEIDRELGEVSDELARIRGMSPREEDALIQRFDDLMTERNSLEASKRFAEPPKPEPKAKPKTVGDAVEERTGRTLDELKEDVKQSKNLDENKLTTKEVKAEENDALKAYDESKKKEYTVQVESNKGRKRKITVEAKSEAEALEIASKRKNVKKATIAEPPKPRPTAAERQAKMVTEADEKADAIRAALGGEEPKAPAKGAKPAAETLTTKTEAKVATKKEPTVVEDLGTIVNRKKEKTTFREKFHEFSSSFKTKISNSLDAYENWNKQFLRSDPDKWKTNNAAINNVRLSQGKAGASINDAHLAADGTRITGSHKVTINGEEHTIEHGKSLMQIFDGMDDETETKFNEYLLLKHSPDRADAGKPIFKDKVLPDGRSYGDREACEELANKLLEEHPEFAVKAEEVYQYLREELQNRVDKGLISQDVVDEWRKKYPNYVPTGRDGDFSGEKDIWDLVGQLENKGNTVGAGGIEKAEGSDQPIRSIKEQLAEATNRNWRDITMNDMFKQVFGEKMGKELAQEADGGIERVLDNSISLSKSKGGKYYAEIYENGEPQRVEIEKHFYDAIEDLYKNGFGNALFDVPNEAFSKVSRFFKNVITTWNPIFMVKNGMRDFTEAIINTRQTKEYLQVLASGEAWNQIKNGGEYWQALKDSGVLQTNFVNLEEALTKGDKWWKKPFDKFAMLQEAVETNPRLVEYMATIKKEMGEGFDLKDGLANVPASIRDIAAANAADVTVNFSRNGSIGKAINKGFVPFFNPSIQGYSKFVRNISEQPSGKALLSMLVKATALGSGATVLNNYFWGDNKNYQRISARDKATNYIIPIPAKWENGKPKFVDVDDAEVFIKIPKSRFAAAYSLPMVNINNDNKMGWAEMIKVAGDQVAPVDPVESNLLSPLLLAHNNTTWYGTPIVSEGIKNENNPSQEYDANTSWFGRQLGKATEDLPTKLQISPKKADYIIDAETGVIGDFLLPMTTPSKQSGDKNAVVRGLKSAGNVVKRQFTIDSVTQNDLSTRFYNARGKAEDDSKTDKAGKAEADESKRYDAFSTEVSKINTAIRALQNGKKSTKQEDIYGLRKVENQLMQDALDGKEAPSSNKTMSAVQKYVGTTYAINNFGSETDKNAMRKYGEKKYGDISKAEMRKAINEDKGFFKGVKAIGNLEERIVKAGTTSNTALTKAVALAGANADDDLFGAYGTIYKSRTETANKMTRARNYFKEGGSEKEYTKLELARRTLGKLPDDQKKSELDKLEKQLAKGEVDWAERDAREKSIEYNANISYLGLAASLAQANAPARGYRLYDIKDKNIQKGINLAAMGFTARDYKEMSKALDTNGNGYPSKQEIIDYVENSGFKDKATLFDALYYYQGKSNPFGTPTKYTREQAALMGKKNGVKAISGESEDIKLNPDEGSSGNGYRGYYRGGYRRWHSWGGGRSRKGRQPISANNSAFKAKKANISGGSSPKMSVSGASNISRTSARVSSNPKIDITPLNVKAVKSAKTGRTSSNLTAALEDIQRTEKKVTPPKARRSK